MWEKNAFGGIFHARFDYVQEKHGKAGVEKLLREMQNNGYTGPMDPANFKTADKYPLEYTLILFDTYCNLFGKMDFDKMARSVPKKKGIVGFFVKWANKPEILFNNAQDYWPKFYDFGSLEGEMVGDKMGILTGHEVSTDPLFCRYLTSYFSGILEAVGMNDVTAEHTMCSCQGDEVCQWKLKWG